MESSKRGLTWAQVGIIATVLVIIFAIFLYKNFDSEKDLAPANPDYALDATYTLNLSKTLSLGLPTIVDFGADSCVPCKEMAPVLKELNSELQGQAIIKFVDVWKNKEIASSLPISLIPTQFFWNSNGTPYVPTDDKDSRFVLHKDKNGTHVYTTHEGGMTKDELLAALKDMGLNP